jgi:hypothetical protein
MAGFFARRLRSDIQHTCAIPSYRLIGSRAFGDDRLSSSLNGTTLFP